jgi:G6PDH family F420-dependent oxidoreductase
MTAWGLHCAHELHSPSALLEHVRAAETAGFDTASCSDPFMGWLPAEGEGGHCWAWLGAASQRCRFPLGVLATPGPRLHPAVLAQAVATIAHLAPQRLWVALGSGERVHEGVTGEPWPSAAERETRLLERVDVIRRLLAGDKVTHEGPGIRVHGARLSTKPPAPVPLYGTASTPETAEWCATWADGLITAPPRACVEPVLQAYRRRGGRGPVILLAQHGWAPNDREAKRLVRRQWPMAGLSPSRMGELATPDDVAEACGSVTEDAVLENVRTSSDLDQHRAWMQEYQDMGFDAVNLFLLGAHPLELIARLGREVLPKLR